ncbi:hypothetical protein V7x_28900 [Crateriforma conspicua]|uniref:Uncharacterized protein n=1 Tax=Crateriforma conspicua TaxID=2527996 RepID=A0A5C6FY57_9PLAN|nr:hypothetical protein V7x_28900 [Crateriforma conspicua]
MCWLWSPEGGACVFSTSELLVAKKWQAEVRYTSRIILQIHVPHKQTRISTCYTLATMRYPF